MLFSTVYHAGMYWGFQPLVECGKYTKSPLCLQWAFTSSVINYRYGSVLDEVGHFLKLNQQKN